VSRDRDRARGRAKGRVRAAALALLAAVSAGAVTPDRVQAQACTVGITGGPVPPGFGSDACVKARDIFLFLAPQVGTALSGGNVMLGEGGALGGWGKRSIVLRTSVVEGYVPARSIDISGTEFLAPVDFGAQRVPVPVPSLDLAIGLLRGVPVGLTNVGGVDLLVGVTYMPSVTRDDFSLRPDGSGIAATLGARVGLLQESAAVPGVAVSYLRRRLPTTTARYTTGDDSLGVLDARVATSVFRLTAKKHFGFIGIGGGIGQDRHDSRTELSAIVNETVSGRAARAQLNVPEYRFTTTRTTFFGNVSFGLPRAQVVLEVGQSRAGDERITLNSFGDRKANEAYRYGSLGIGLRF
jgi:hypothetical protein